MDSLHYILILFLILIIGINNISIIKKYYYPWFFSFVKKITKKIKRYKCNLLPKKIIKTNEARKAEIYSNISFEELKLIQEKLSWKYDVAILNLNCNLNVGAIYRTGCLLGMSKYLILGKRIYYPKAQVGIDYTPIEYLDTFDRIRDRHDSRTVENFNIKIFLDYIRKNNLIPIIIEQNGTNLLKINFAKKESALINNEKYLFIFGNETHGVPRRLLNQAKINNWLILTIPQWGCAHSFNVSQAANIVMWKYYYDNISKLYQCI